MSSGNPSASSPQGPRKPWSPPELRGENNGVLILQQLKYPGGESYFMPMIKSAIMGAVAGKTVGDNELQSFPKELAYVEDMESWNKIAGKKDYKQTGDEVEFLKHHTAYIVQKMMGDQRFPNIVTVDLGAARSDKITHVIGELKSQGISNKNIKYVAVDINNQSLEDQVIYIHEKYGNDFETMGLHGTFEHANDYYKKIDGTRIFCSFGSIFFNGPDEVVKRRCEEMAGHLRPHELLIVGQDSPHPIDKAEYDNPTYRGFIRSCLKGVHRYAGIKAEEVAECWSLEAKSSPDSNVWIATAQQNMKCEHIGGIEIPAGTKFQMFKSWKQGEAYCRRQANAAGLELEVLERPPTLAAGNSWREYLIYKSFK